MSVDRLWAPWRIKYIKAKRQKGCIFCRAVKQPSTLYAVFKTKYCLAMLNIFPYNNGHIMVSPIRHIDELAQLKEEEMVDLFRALNKAKTLLDKTIKPEGYNIGINISKSAGQGLTGHLHIHIVPRWTGDTNFMPTIHGTKVISQSLDELYRRLKNADAKRN